LLVPPSSAPSTGLDVRLSPEGEVFVQGLTKHKVESVDEVFKIFDKGSLNRATAATNLNEHSSRSHSILLVEVTTSSSEGTHVGKLYLIDLAGSERVTKSGVTGVAMKEAQNINRSLSALGDVMEALDSKSKHVPFRNSVLTFLLQNSLGGSARTMMLITVCPTDLTSDETLFTLQFASRVRNITLGVAKRNNNASVKNLEDQYLALKSELKECKRKKMSVEEALLELKREKKREGDKVSNQMDTKIRQYEEARKASDAMIAQLQKVNTDNALKLMKEREGKSASAQELERLQRTTRKLQEQLTSLTKERDELTLTVKLLRKSSLAPHPKLASSMTTLAGGKPIVTPVDDEFKSQDDLSIDPKSVVDENEEASSSAVNSGKLHLLLPTISFQCSTYFSLTASVSQQPKSRLLKSNMSAPSVVAEKKASAGPRILSGLKPPVPVQRTKSSEPSRSRTPSPPRSRTSSGDAADDTDVHLVATTTARPSGIPKRDSVSAKGSLSGGATRLSSASGARPSGLPVPAAFVAAPPSSPSTTTTNSMNNVAARTQEALLRHRVRFIVLYIFF